MSSAFSATLPHSSTYDPDGGRVVGLKGLDRNLEVSIRQLEALTGGFATAVCALSTKGCCSVRLSLLTY